MHQCARGGGAICNKSCDRTCGRRGCCCTISLARSLSSPLRSLSSAFTLPSIFPHIYTHPSHTPSRHTPPSGCLLRPRAPTLQSAHPARTWTIAAAAPDAPTQGASARTARCFRRLLSRLRFSHNCRRSSHSSCQPRPPRLAEPPGTATQKGPRGPLPTASQVALTGAGPAQPGLRISAAQILGPDATQRCLRQAAPTCGGSLRPHVGGPAGSRTPSGPRARAPHFRPGQRMCVAARDAQHDGLRRPLLLAAVRGGRVSLSLCSSLSVSLCLCLCFSVSVSLSPPTPPLPLSCRSLSRSLSLPLSLPLPHRSSRPVKGSAAPRGLPRPRSGLHCLSRHYRAPRAAALRDTRQPVGTSQRWPGSHRCLNRGRQTAWWKWHPPRHRGSLHAIGVSSTAF